jgi:hypothetical protein
MTPEELWTHAKAVLGDIPLDHPLWGNALRSEGDRAGRMVCVGRSDSLDGDLLPLLSLCLGRQLCVYELWAVSQFIATTSASPIRRYGPDTTYFPRFVSPGMVELFLGCRSWGLAQRILCLLRGMMSCGGRSS